MFTVKISQSKKLAVKRSQTRKAEDVTKGMNPQTRVCSLVEDYSTDKKSFLTFLEQ